MVPVVVALEVVAEQLLGGVERVLLAVVRDQAVRGGCGNCEGGGKCLTEESEH